MKKRVAIVLGLSLMMFSSCIKDPVLPAAEPSADLYSNFYAEINGAAFELTENVVGYTNVTSKEQVFAISPDFSTAAYFSAMSSPSVFTSVKVGLGSVSWNANVSSEPSLAVFNDFMLTNTIPAYSDSALIGFEFTYTGADKREWKSSELSLNIQDVEFTGIDQVSDATGDYSSFTCSFNCYAYSLNLDSLAILPMAVNHIDSISIENAIYQGWFKR